MEMTESERRRNAIVALLTRHGELPVTALVEEMSVSAQTIRSDLRALDEARVVRRRHGAVRLNNQHENLGYQPRQKIASDEKARIAGIVAAQIPDGATVALGAGTTVEAVAHALAGHKRLTVATNNLHVALALRGSAEVTVLIAGGQLRPGDLDVIGPDSLAFFGGLNFDHAVFSVGGLSDAGVLLDFTPDEIQARRAIMSCARSRTLVLDHTKIGRAAPFSWGDVSSLERIVCGGDLPADVARMALEAGCEVLGL